MDFTKNGLNCLKCQHRHPDNGNCTAVGGFCTAVPAAYCPLIPELLARAKKAEHEREKFKQRWFESAERASQLSDAIDRAGLWEEIEAAEKQTNN